MPTYVLAKLRSAKQRSWWGEAESSRKVGRLSAGLGRLAAVFLLIGAAGPWFNGIVAGAENAGQLSAPLSSPRVTTFRCDVTPPIGGQPLIWLDPPETVEDPLWAKGIVLESGGQRYALCALDWCGVCNSSYDLIRDALAAAIETSPENVFVHTVHQHTAPYIDGNAQRHMAAYSELPTYVDFAFLDRCAEAVASAARESLTRLEPFDRVGVGKAVVERVASSRRVRDENGTLTVRYSSGGKDPKMRELPEGRIDPYLRTISLAQGDRPIVRLHFYATHPQSFYGDRRVSADVPGMARERLEQEEGVFQIYLTGCAGDVTLGKYNDGSREARDAITLRLYEGMKGAVRATQYGPADRFAWCSRPVVFSARNDPGQTPEDLRRVLADANVSPLNRTLAAVRLSFFDRQDKPFAVQGLRIGSAVALFLPGESLLEFQEYAISLAGDRCFAAVAAYGDLGTGYICYDAAFQEGGYEPTASRVAPGAEGILKEAIRYVMTALQ